MPRTNKIELVLLLFCKLFCFLRHLTFDSPVYFRSQPYSFLEFIVIVYLHKVFNFFKLCIWKMVLFLFPHTSMFLNFMDLIFPILTSRPTSSVVSINRTVIFILRSIDYMKKWSASLSAKILLNYFPSIWFVSFLPGMFPYEYIFSL